MTNLAIIDLGSNSVRLKVSQLTDSGQTKLLRYEKEYVRLSEDMGPEKLLKTTPIERTVAQLARFMDICRTIPNVQLITTATAAVRQAVNRAEFIDRVKREVGLDIHVISGEHEAYLDYLGVSRTLPIKNGLIIDTGGASMELILVDDGYAEEAISLPMGSVLLSQRYHLGDHIAPENLYDAIIHVDEVLAGQRWLNRARHLRVVALGGSNRALAKMYRWQRLADGGNVPPVHGLTMSTSDAFALMHQLIATEKAGRAAIRGVSAARADVIVGGLLPLMALLRQLHMKQLMFSSNGLREGLLFQYQAGEVNPEMIQRLDFA
ncbi:Ppx/GppA family phosphatase [uncultured Limosilactobacillus sp.]|uniref:Ppx/GppA family phosphatase n=1 Tax=uncultured Limosilactobacillus sp. TaxID=2837629 RepID=UPI0025FB5C60|nr:Ppx/GppA family phosphatase [uncultured Limosilactobacillus sp.]